VIDRDMTPSSRELTGQLEGSTFFKLKYSTFSEKEAAGLMDDNKCSLILEIPSGFGRDLGKGNPGKIMASINAINASTAQLTWAYLNGVLRDYNLTLMAENPGTAGITPVPMIQVTNRYWYNEMLNYRLYMVPGILGILVTAIGFLLAGLNLVREKEVGTIEQINVTPVRKYHFIIGKMAPFLVIGLIDLALGMILGRLLFKLPFEGSIGLLFLCSSIFLVAILGFALFISTFAGTQQQFMFIAFFCMIIFILMSGIFTPLESMPVWAQRIDLVNPVAYIMRINRMVILKGSTIRDISTDIWSLMLIAVFFTTFAVKRYRKTAQ
jgi:ABC-2 type transport system permease protein